MRARAGAPSVRHRYHRGDPEQPARRLLCDEDRHRRFVGSQPTIWALLLDESGDVLDVVGAEWSWFVVKSRRNGPGCRVTELEVVRAGAGRIA
jgi:hypothetical protein